MGMIHGPVVDRDREQIVPVLVELVLKELVRIDILSRQRTQNQGKKKAKAFFRNSMVIV
ncbi:MAG: hypothetical protein IKW89_06925 [Bacteroidales bacterium]|nr:hypothetical protein [Bacteroidales bacterium]